MKGRVGMVAAAALVLAMGAAACGSSGSSGGGTTPSSACDFSNTSSLSTTGTNTDTNFSTNGQFTLGFVAQDSSGTAVLAGSDCGASAQVIKEMTFGGWKETFLKANATGGIGCDLTAPTGTTCTLQSVTSTAPASGNGSIAGVALIDDSGSMSGSDPNNARDPAADAFLDAVCSTATNIFGVLDFGNGSNMSFMDTRDLMTANGVTNADLTGTPAALPYATCAAANVTLAKTAIGAQITASGGTPLYESVLEVCNDLVAKKASGGQLAGFTPALLVLSDGDPNSDSNKSAAESCVSTNNILTCTVGLGPGSELSSSPSSAAVAALKSLATAGRCTYAAATDAAALTPIFTAIGTGASSGFNTAIFGLSPIPATGTTVTGTLTVGTATATFTFIAP